MSQVISSLHNARVKEIAKLGKRSYRDRKRLTVVEGGRELELALSASVLPSRVFVCRQLLNESSSAAADQCAALAATGLTSLYEVSAEVYAKMAYRGGSGGLLAVIPYFDRSLQDVILDHPVLALVVEGAEKPGNLGALLRTADAAGVDIVIVCGGGTDVYNPNVVRASLGALFTVPTFQTDANEAIAWLRANGLRTVAASPDAVAIYSLVDLTGSTAIILGSEAQGLSQVWANAADQRVRIPMYGRVDSLNLAASAAILLYEAVRQRQYHAAHSGSN